MKVLTCMQPLWFSAFLRALVVRHALWKVDKAQPVCKVLVTFEEGKTVLKAFQKPLKRQFCIALRVKF